MKHLREIRICQAIGCRSVLHHQQRRYCSKRCSGRRQAEQRKFGRGTLLSTIRALPDRLLYDLVAGGVI